MHKQQAPTKSTPGIETSAVSSPGLCSHPNQSQDDLHISGSFPVEHFISSLVCTSFLQTHLPTTQRTLGQRRGRAGSLRNLTEASACLGHSRWLHTEWPCSLVPVLRVSLSCSESHPCLTGSSIVFPGPAMLATARVTPGSALAFLGPPSDCLCLLNSSSTVQPEACSSGLVQRLELLAARGSQVQVTILPFSTSEDAGKTLHSPRDSVSAQLIKKTLSPPYLLLLGYAV